MNQKLRLGWDGVETMEDELTTNEGSGIQIVERRKLLTGSMFVLSSLIFAAIGGSAGAYLVGGQKEQKQEEWTDAGELPELHPGAPEQITFERSRTDGWKVRRQKDTAWIILNNDGTLTAFSPLCTHLGCAYQWSAQRRQFSCPCHGSAFSATGAVLAGPAARPLDRFPIRMEGSRLWLGPAQVSQDS
jgi:menaquinol-cytochrome c reductase iron-sulfur subunit